MSIRRSSFKTKKGDAGYYIKYISQCVTKNSSGDIIGEGLLQEDFPEIPSLRSVCS